MANPQADNIMSIQHMVRHTPVPEREVLNYNALTAIATGQFALTDLEQTIIDIVRFLRYTRGPDYKFEAMVKTLEYQCALAKVRADSLDIRLITSIHEGLRIMPDGIDAGFSDPYDGPDGYVRHRPKTTNCKALPAKKLRIDKTDLRRTLLSRQVNTEPVLSFKQPAYRQPVRIERTSTRAPPRMRQELRPSMDFDRYEQLRLNTKHPPFLLPAAEFSPSRRRLF